MGNKESQYGPAIRSGTSSARRRGDRQVHCRAVDGSHGAGRRAAGQENGYDHQHPKTPFPLDKVNREFRVSRPNALWVVDFTYVPTWAGFVFVAFLIAAYTA